MINKNIDLCGFIVDNANDINKDAGKMTYKYVGNPASLFLNSIVQYYTIIPVRSEHSFPQRQIRI